jgi:2-hydroxychromene-2-carboxylate isomerase
MPGSARFVFSLRSPYAWIAARWALPRLPADFPLEWTPFYPLPTFSNFAKPIDSKTRYLIRDVKRLVEHYGGRVTFPMSDAVDWAIPHCAFLAARERGRGRELALALWAARFERGNDLADESVLARAAEEAGVDVDAVMSAALDDANRASLDAQIQRAFDEEGIFGVPTIVLAKGTRFWGHDRIEWAIDKGLISD